MRDERGTGVLIGILVVMLFAGAILVKYYFTMQKNDVSLVPRVSPSPKH